MLYHLMCVYLDSKLMQYLIYNITYRPSSVDILYLASIFNITLSALSPLLSPFYI